MKVRVIGLFLLLCVIFISLQSCDLPKSNDEFTSSIGTDLETMDDTGSFYREESIWLPNKFSNDSVYDIKTEVYSVSTESINAQINYPSFYCDGIDLTFANESIKNKIDSFYSNWTDNISDSQTVTINLSFEAALASNDFISVVFRGYANNTTAAHPSNCVFTVNIDLSSKKIVTLEDNVNINESFFDEVKKTMSTSVKDKEQYDYISELDFNTLFEKPDSLSSSVCSYYTVDSMVLVISVPHAIGDYVEIFLK